jgi:hypothetical protein
MKIIIIEPGGFEPPSSRLKASCIIHYTKIPNNIYFFFIIIDFDRLYFYKIYKDINNKIITHDLHYHHNHVEKSIKNNHQVNHYYLHQKY